MVESQKGKTKILCSCKKHKNKVLIDPFTGHVKMHLLKRDFMLGYKWWTRHGEDARRMFFPTSKGWQMRSEKPFRRRVGRRGNDQGEAKHEEDLHGS